MKIEQMKIRDIKPYERNAKKHDETQIKNVMQSIGQYGITQPLVIDRDNNLIIGHCRLIACKRLKMKEVPVVRRDDLTQEQVDKLRLLDNKLNESEWDFDLLAEDIPTLDFSDFEIDWGLPDDEEETTIIEDEAPQIDETKDPVCKLGDIWQLGDHRLICGDSTDANIINYLMGGEKADLVVTDPPYNMAYEGSGNTKDRASKRILNDNMPEPEFEQFMQKVYNAYYASMKDGASIYVFYKELGSGVFMRKMRDAGLTFKQELIWVKSQLVLGGSKYQSMYEPCLMGCKGKSIKKWNGGRKQRSVIETIDFMSEDELRSVIKEMLAESDDIDVIREKKQLVNDLHPTMKPIRLLAKLIKNSSDKEDIVVDLFGGSGSTLIACEQLNRKCYMAELDPRYCDVIVERWEKLTGRKAVLLNV